MKMDNRVFYKMLLELEGVEVKTLIYGEYKIIKDIVKEDQHSCLFYFKNKHITGLVADDYKLILKCFAEEYLRLSDVIAFAFDFDLKPMIGNVITDYKEFSHNGTLFQFDQRTKNTFYVEWTAEKDGYYLERFLKFNLTDEQIEKFKADRIAFSNYLRSEVM